MSDRIERKTYAPTSECARINQLAESASKGAAEAKKRIYSAGDDARRCGELLLAEKAKVQKENGRGGWTDYFEVNHAPYFTLRTAQRWMGIAQVERVEDAPQNDNVVSEHRNELRGVMVALEIFPKKTNIPIEGDKPATRSSSFLVIGNRFKAWHANWRKINGAARPSEAQLTNFRLDVRPLLEFLEVYPKEQP